MPTEFVIENVSENRAKISAHPFEIGYAITLAHPLKRLLSMSTKGYAPTSIRIADVQHEFDSKRGMLEDIAIFIINVKNLRLKLPQGVEKASFDFSFKGPKEIRGADLVCKGLEVVNPDTYLATINKDAALDFSLVVEQGIGYVASEEIRELVPSGHIALDAFFTPVRNVTYDIENVLFEDNPDYERIVFDITTDGQISPLVAFENALEAMYQQLEVFKKISTPNEYMKVAHSASANSEMNRLLKSVSELSLSTRSRNGLEKAGIKLIAELALMDTATLSDIKNLGKESVKEIKNMMENIDFPVGFARSASYKDQLIKRVAEMKAELKKEEENQE